MGPGFKSVHSHDVGIFDDGLSFPLIVVISTPGDTVVLERYCMVYHPQANKDLKILYKLNFLCFGLRYPILVPEMEFRVLSFKNPGLWLSNHFLAWF
ncbi:MAG: hypothetical protein Ct9H300mP11_14180 [Chloroflexota bacterium]|nr:MAG: hypothetical protein Ct9H300mP11_14180 [Chloroflexota bacterium]